MKKYYLLLLLAIFSWPGFARAEGSVVNNVNGGTVNQFFILGCDWEKCQELINKIMQGNYQSSTITPAGNVVPTEQTETSNVLDDSNNVMASFPAKSLRISEIVAIPSPDENEWVEIFNPGTNAIDLSNWYLIEGSGRKTGLSGTINPGEYRVFDKSSLNNSGDVVSLFDPAQNLIDEVRYGDWENSVVSAGTATNSIILYEGEYKETTLVTKGLVNILISPLPDPVPQSEVKEVVPEVKQEIVETPVSETKSVEEIKAGKVIINEFLPNPETGEEWIELYNTENYEINLNGWTLDDIESGGSAPFTIKDVKIPANSYYVFNQLETKISLNNDKDSVVLKNLESVTVSSYSYQSSQKGISWSYFEDGWVETTKPTPFEKNIKVEVEQVSLEAEKTLSSAAVKKTEEYKTVSLKDFVNLALKSKVKVEGSVISMPGDFNEKTMYLDGVQLYFSKADWPEITLGNKLSVKGAVSEANGERRLLISDRADLSVLEKGDAIDPIQLKSTEINSENLARIVELEGKFLEKKTNKLLFADEAGEFIVYFNSKLKTAVESLIVGQDYKVVGILTKSENEFRLNPRTAEDIKVIEQEIVAKTETFTDSPPPPKISFWLGIMAITLLLINLYFLWQKRSEIMKAMMPVQKIITQLVKK